MAIERISSPVIIGNAEVTGNLSVTGTTSSTGAFSADTISEVTAAAGVTVDGTLIKDGGATLKDSVTFITDDADATKKIAFQASGITTATTRTITMPDTAVDLGTIATNTAALAAIYSGSAQILAGQASVDVSIPGVNSKPAVACFKGSTFDATAIRLTTYWFASGTLRIVANANATGNTDVWYVVDGR